MTYSARAHTRSNQIVDQQQQAYFCSGYGAGRKRNPYKNNVQQEASAGYEEDCYYDEGFRLGSSEPAA
jgi:hypothetical protein